MVSMRAKSRIGMSSRYPFFRRAGTTGSTRAPRIRMSEGWSQKLFMVLLLSALVLASPYTHLERSRGARLKGVHNTAQGNALGIHGGPAQALKGRHQHCRARRWSRRWTGTLRLGAAAIPLF